LAFIRPFTALEDPPNLKRTLRTIELLGGPFIPSEEGPVVWTLWLFTNNLLQSEGKNLVTTYLFNFIIFRNEMHHFKFANTKGVLLKVFSYDLILIYIQLHGVD
jgi:hypothetical protein